MATRCAADVLLVPHHGSRTSSSEALLAAVAPRVALVQAGYRSRFGHPAAEVVARYAARGMSNWCAATPAVPGDGVPTAACTASARKGRALLASSAPHARRTVDARAWPGACNGSHFPGACRVSIHVALNHVTHYRYDRRVGLSPQVVRLRPAPHCRTPILSAIRCASSPASTSSTGSRTRSPTTSRGWSSPRRPPTSRSPSTWWPRWRSTTRSTSSSSPRRRSFPFAYAPDVERDLAPYLAKGPPTPRFAAFVASVAARAAAHDRLPGRHQPAPAARHPLPDPHGARRADARADADQRGSAPAATPAGCWCRRCATWGWRRASCPAT
jgi:hypothetical protein